MALTNLFRTTLSFPYASVVPDSVVFNQEFIEVIYGGNVVCSPCPRSYQPVRIILVPFCCTETSMASVQAILYFRRLKGSKCNPKAKPWYPTEVVTWAVSTANSNNIVNIDYEGDCLSRQLLLTEWRDEFSLLDEAPIFQPLDGSLLFDNDAYVMDSNQSCCVEPPEGCPINFEWDQELCECVCVGPPGGCPSGTTLNVETCQCEPDTLCPPGYQLINGVCTPPPPIEDWLPFGPPDFEDNPENYVWIGVTLVNRDQACGSDQNRAGKFANGDDPCFKLTFSEQVYAQPPNQPYYAFSQYYDAYSTVLGQCEITDGLTSTFAFQSCGNRNDYGYVVLIPATAESSFDIDGLFTPSAVENYFNSNGWSFFKVDSFIQPPPDQFCPILKASIGMIAKLPVPGGTFTLKQTVIETTFCSSTSLPSGSLGALIESLSQEYGTLTVGPFLLGVEIVGECLCGS